MSFTAWSDKKAVKCQGQGVCVHVCALDDSFIGKKIKVMK